MVEYCVYWLENGEPMHEVFSNLAAAEMYSCAIRGKENVEWVEALFFMDGSDLRSGFTTFGDFSPHTAMIRSFSFHNNFPTQYPHYGGVDVKYHFMFQEAVLWL